MDARHFDALTRILMSGKPRRRLLGLLAAVPLLGGLLALGNAEDAVGKDRRRRRKQRHRKHKGKSQSNRNKSQSSCKPKSRAAVCAGVCGEVKSKQTCGKPVDCGPCACQPACGECFVCDTATRTCVVDSAQVGDACGGAGQVCGADGTCACSETSCPVCMECGNDGVCAGCTGCCDGETCVTECPTCTTCDGGACVNCTACCDASGVCRDGNSKEFCGHAEETCISCTGQEICDGGACVCQPATCTGLGKDCGDISDGCGDTISCGSCGNSKPICVSNVCETCSRDAECGSGAVCCGGSCFTGVCCEDSACLDAKAPDCDDHTCTCESNSNTPCDGDLACCAAGCIDVQDDPANCGACGNACGAGKICVEGACKTCDVTCNAADHMCDGTQLQAKISGGGTIHVCPGIYTGEFDVGVGATVKIIGAGNTDDPSESTILKTTRNRNLTVESATSVTLIRVHIRGTGDLGSQCLGSGIRITSSNMTMRQSVISNLGTKFCTSGVRFDKSTVELIDSEIVDNYTYGHGAGANVSGGTLTLRHSTIRDNLTPGHGGGVYLSEGAKLYLEEGSLITRNYGYGGSGVDTEAGTTVTISADSAIRDNEFNDETPQCGGAGTVIGTCG